MLFPKINKSVKFDEQLDKIKAEVDEAVFELGCYPLDNDAFFIECLDVIHTAETLLHKLHESMTDKEFIRLRDIVYNKNKVRGYYD